MQPKFTVTWSLKEGNENNKRYVATWLTVLDCPAFCRKPIAGAKLGKPKTKIRGVISVWDRPINRNYISNISMGSMYSSFFLCYRFNEIYVTQIGWVGGYHPWYYI